jgi:hypothetical protein
MNPKNLICLIGCLLVTVTSARADIYTYTFSLSGAGANPPNNSLGLASGTITLNDSDTVTLDITYSGLSSDLTQVFGHWGLGPGTSAGCEFYAGDLPSSGHWVDTLNFPTGLIKQSIELGLGNLQVGTVNFPFSGFGEIGGFVDPVAVPEPSSFAVALLAAGFWFRRNISRRPMRVV